MQRPDQWSGPAADQSRAAGLQARFTGQAGKEFTWFALGASLPLLSMDAERAARQIIEAVRARRAEIILTLADQLVSQQPVWRPG